jgi:NAD+ synthase
MEQIATRIADWLRDYAHGAGSHGYVVGLSGGVDSAVTAALCVRAVGGENVVLVKMPCPYRPLDDELANDVAGWLGVPIQLTFLTMVYEQMMVELGTVVGTPGPPIVAGNLKARLRMAALYTIANARGILVAGTGNRTELELGYFTKYGDGGVDVLPIGDLYKTQVWELARYLGVPEAVITRTPTAGLWEGQTDEGELGYCYEELDTTLRAMHEETVSFDVPDAKLSPVARRILELRHAAYHKLNVPPICLIGGVP